MCCSLKFYRALFFFGLFLLLTGCPIVAGSHGFISATAPFLPLFGLLSIRYLFVHLGVDLVEYYEEGSIFCFDCRCLPNHRHFLLLFIPPPCFHYSFAEQKCKRFRGHKSGPRSYRIYFLHILSGQLKPVFDAQELLYSTLFSRGRHHWNASLDAPSEKNFGFCFFVCGCHGSYYRVNEQASFSGLEQSTERRVRLHGDIDQVCKLYHFVLRQIRVGFDLVDQRANVVVAVDDVMQHCFGKIRDTKASRQASFLGGFHCVPGVTNAVACCKLYGPRDSVLWKCHAFQRWSG